MIDEMAVTEAVDLRFVAESGLKATTLNGYWPRPQTMRSEIKSRTAQATARIRGDRRLGPRHCSAIVSIGKNASGVRNTITLSAAVDEVG